MKILLLDVEGVLATLAIGIAVILLSGARAFPYLLLLLAFLFLGVLVTKYQKQRKTELGVYEHERSWQNVIANGIVPVLCIALIPFIPNAHGAYIGAVAAAASDKFASEIGTLGGKPTSLISFKKVAPGTSGAISFLGSLMAFNGAALIGIAAMILYPNYTFPEVLIIALVGFAGNFADSIVGILEARGIGNKSTTNIICALVGALLGHFLISGI
ncbi:MAG: DUF92 domain-containing protein [Candidatus Micrarchaeota archaeon]